jgi:hypothetical protein
MSGKDESVNGHVDQTKPSECAFDFKVYYDILYDTPNSKDKVGQDYDGNLFTAEKQRSNDEKHHKEPKYLPLGWPSRVPFFLMLFHRFFFFEF